jgi:MFS family permease
VKQDVATAGGSERTGIDRRYVTAALMLVMVLASMEQTITSTAMPTIIGELHGIEHYSWVASIYLLASTVSMPLYGRMADALGRKKVVLGAIGLFCLSSVLASTSRSMEQLILYRGLQGLGAGGIMPVVLTILGDIFTLEERAKIQGFFSGVWGTSAMAGPALGAFLVKGLGWRSVFYVNLPFGLVAAVVLAWKYQDKEKPHSTDLDLPGAAALAVLCTAVLALVSRLGPGGWGWEMAAGLGIAAIGSGVYFVRHERRVENPIISSELVTRREIWPSMLASMLLGVGFLCLDTYVPLYVQGGKGGGVFAAAGVVTPVMLTWAMSGVFAAPLVVRWGFRKTALLGSTLMVVGFVGLVLAAVFNWSHAALTGVLAITGFGLGPASMSCLLAAQDAVGWQQRGVVTSMVQFSRTIGGAVGIGVAGALFNILIHPEMAKLEKMGVAPSMLLDTHAREGLSVEVMEEVRRMISGGLIWVFVMMAVFAVAQWVVLTRMPRKKAGHVVSGAEALEAAVG